MSDRNRNAARERGGADVTDRELRELDSRIRREVDRCIEEADGVWVVATSLLFTWIKGAREKYIERLAEIGCRYMVRKATHEKRSKILRSISDEAVDRVKLEGSLDYPLYGGKKLRGCARREILQEAGGMAALSSQIQRRAAWLYAIARALPNDTVTVGEALTPEIITALWGDACKSVMKAQRMIRSERVKAGIEAARMSGVRIGRPMSVTGHRLLEMRTLRDQGLSTRKIAALLGTTKGTVHRTMKRLDALYAAKQARAD